VKTNLPEHNVCIVVAVDFNGSDIAICSEKPMYLPSAGLVLEVSELDLEVRPFLPVVSESRVVVTVVNPAMRIPSSFWSITVWR